jgi:endonuclease-8
MPEGPSIVILKEQASPFLGKTIERLEGNTTIEKERLLGQRVEALRSWGKHFLIEVDIELSLRVHFMLFGSYRINERKSWAVPRLSLGFDNGELNLYACSVRFIELPLDLVYDWQADVMSPHWDAKLALARLRAQPDTLVCDALLDQDLFAGVGNIIKNEVLFRIRVHPLSTVGALPAARLRELVREARQYSFDFYEWKKQFVLKKHWLAHTKRTCPRCQIPFVKAHLGRTHRRSFYCENCQVRYG